MAHLVETMAFVRDTPWHGLGNQLTPNQPIERWITEAGMDWSIHDSPVLFNVANDGLGYDGTVVSSVKPLPSGAAGRSTALLSGSGFCRWL